MSDSAKSMREQLDEAWNKNQEIADRKTDEESEEERGPEEDPEEPVRDTEKEEAPVEEEKPGGDEEEKVQPDEEKSPEEDKDGKPRKSESKDKSGGKPDKSDKPGGERRDAKDEKVDELKAPASWKPATREHWAKLPREVKEEINRRETEIARGLHQASGFRKVAEEYFNTVKPFEQLIRAQNSTPAKAITNLMTTASRLTLGTKAQKAQVVFEIMKNYDVDVEALDTLLVGKKLDESDDKVAKLLDEKLKPFQEFMTGVRKTQEDTNAKSEEEVANELEAFANDKNNEFFNDVVEDMADLMDLASKRGQKMDLKTAYDKACKMNPEVSKILDQRKRAKKGNLDQEALNKKKEAASSIRGDKGEDSDGKKDVSDLGAAIRQAWGDLEEAR